MKLKINLFNSLYHYHLVFVISIILIINFIFSFLEFNVFHFFSFLIFTLILVFWALTIHIQYYKDGKHNTISIESRSIYIYNSETKLTESYEIKNISKLLYVRSASIDPPVVFIYTIVENFHFLRVYFNDGDHINITSLMRSDLTQVVALFSDFEIVRIKKLYCSLKGNYEKQLNTPP